MNKSLYQLVLAGVLLWTLNGCVQRGLPELPESMQSPQAEGWQQTQGEPDENIDISDLDKNLTEETPAQAQPTTPRNGKVARIPFPVREYAALKHMGKATVKGRIYLTDGFGTKIYGRNTRLYLNPKTSYSDQWYKESYIGGRKMEKADDRLFDYLRFTSSDNGGNFAFYGVPDGKYYLIGTVTCGMECGYETPKKIRIATIVSVHGNETVYKDLNATFAY